MLNPLNVWPAVILSDPAESSAEGDDMSTAGVISQRAGHDSYAQTPDQLCEHYPLTDTVQQGKPGYIPCSCDYGGPDLENACHQNGCDQESLHFHTSNEMEGEVFVMSPRSLLLHSLFSYSFFPPTAYHHLVQGQLI
ncbi:uncharacterized [Tachysurus ichikawai]